jgi:hypothetical protein
MKLSINAVLVGVLMLLAFTSCTKKDNYEGPDASLQGSVFVEGTQNTVQTNTGNFTIRLEQLNWSSNPEPFDIPVKIDGTYKNSKLFGGHYRVSVHGGAFWPADIQEMDIANGSKLDFKLTPYLFINNFAADMVDSTTLKLKFDLEAPIDGIPTITEIQPFVNTTKIVGPGASIFDFSDLNKVTVNKEWTDFTSAEKSREITISNLIRGRTFFVRVGVRFNNDDKSYNLSEVLEVAVP